MKIKTTDIEMCIRGLEGERDGAYAACKKLQARIAALEQQLNDAKEEICILMRTTVPTELMVQNVQQAEKRGAEKRREELAALVDSIATLEKQNTEINSKYTAACITIRGLDGERDGAYAACRDARMDMALDAIDLFGEHGFSQSSADKLLEIAAQKDGVK